MTNQRKLLVVACILSLTLLTSCQEESKDQVETTTQVETVTQVESAPQEKVKYRVGSAISDAYVNPDTIVEVAEVDIRAKGFVYDYDTLTYDLVWSDEFDYEGAPDETKWSYDVGGHGWGNNELQYYTNGDNATVENGNLVIEARKEEQEGKEYTSSRLVTKGKGDWLYGKIEVRAKLPSGVGTWPAIWMLPTDWVYGSWPASGEIDIMEHVGYRQNTIHASIHTKSYYHTIGTQKTATKYIETASEDFHVYTVEWLPDKIMAYIDDELYFTFEPVKYKPNPTTAEWPFDQKMHLLLNIAVGGNWGGANGVDESIYPVEMLVDYVRVYQSKEITNITKQE
ncbi:MAG: laminarinase, glycosyl hydrolase family 16 er [Anaerocolumna sp.]|jgi:beta-glucanase (GH16 family)|nr:laminarinase, glycosyl hydrolase family 16 er [Anaerocolumna sp.]